MQHPVHKPLQAKHGYPHGDRARWYRTIDLGVWRDAYNCLNSLGFLKGDFCGALGCTWHPSYMRLTSAWGLLGCAHL